jgi:hypothetical protein
MSKDKKVWNGQNNLLEVQGSKTVGIKVACWEFLIGSTERVSIAAIDVDSIPGYP